MQSINRSKYEGTNMSFLVYGRYQVENEKYLPEEGHILISITDPINGQKLQDVGPVNLPPSDLRLDVLRLEFFDIDQAVGNLKIFSDSQVDELYNFVDKWKDKVKLIVVNCEFGVCRSAAVAAALSKWFNGDDEYFFKTFCPNSLVYTKVLYKYFGDPWEEYRTNAENYYTNGPIF